MSYRLVLTELTAERTKDVGQNVFLDNLSEKHEVFVLYYPGARTTSFNDELYAKLRTLGNSVGQNLLVNIVSLSDPWYSKTVRTFDITNLPAIVVTAVVELASLKSAGRYFTAYVRNSIDKEPRSLELVIKLIEMQYNFFISRRISEALREHRAQEVRLDKTVSFIASDFSKVAKGIEGFLEKDVIMEWAMTEGKLEVRPRFE